MHSREKTECDESFWVTDYLRWRRETMLDYSM